MEQYQNLWLSLTTFAAISPTEKAREEFKMLTDALIKIFNQNHRWEKKHISLDQASNISVAVAVLQVKDQTFIDDVSQIIKNKKHEIEPSHITNLVKSSFYFTNDLYEFVHQIALDKINEIPAETKKTLGQIFKDHKRIGNSPFI